jgi:hypothetical protein
MTVAELIAVLIELPAAAIVYTEDGGVPYKVHGAYLSDDGTKVDVT